MAHMWKKKKSAGQDVTHTNERTSGRNSGSSESQLSDSDGVSSDVSSVALNHGLLAVSGNVSAAVDASATSDAEVMLRVKAGDDAAFDYLVQKYRRPIISFMYRMRRQPVVHPALQERLHQANVTGIHLRLGWVRDFRWLLVGALA